MEESNFESEGSNMDEDIKSETKVEVGDNFVVISYELENGDTFYVILCDKPLQRCGHI
jgi:hypothetical protein